MYSFLIVLHNLSTNTLSIALCLPSKPLVGFVVSTNAYPSISEILIKGHF